MKRRRFEILLTGIVQGVGFRPFVFRLARRHGLQGYVLNRTADVVIDVEGENGSLEPFLRDLQEQIPPAAMILDLAVRERTPANYSAFEIKKSEAQDRGTPLISPDIATCDLCRDELFDAADRRYGYPFTNCTNCGPRFTITRSMPYDRVNTSMSRFRMCPDCQKEYDNPEHRRFHAQPNACPKCGPHLRLVKADGQEVACDSIFQRVEKELRAGKILAIKGLGGYHLAVDPFNENAVTRLRERKGRWRKPLALMVRDLESARELCRLSKAEVRIMSSAACPILLAPRRPESRIAPSVAPGTVELGLMLPYTPLHHWLLRNLRALVMTSGNRTDEPIVIKEKDAFERLNGIADLYLVHDREILVRSDDSVVRVMEGEPVLIRRSRGYAPSPLLLQHEGARVLAVGADLKNTFCLLQGNRAYPGQHIGDLEHPDAEHFFHESLSHFQRMLNFEPEAVAHDLHPGYFSTGWARRMDHVETHAVQHHHAHIASCLAENREQGPVIGLAMDGTGYGDDGQVWGGEVLLADCASYSRSAHFEYLPLPGGDAAIHEPWRMAVSAAVHALGEDFEPSRLRTMSRDEERITALARLTRNRVFCPLTSSLGRLFDAVSALLGLGGIAAYEGEAAIALEMAMHEGGNRYRRVPGRPPLPLFWEERDGQLEIRTGRALRQILDQIERGKPRSRIARDFHGSIVLVLADLCDELRRRHGIDIVALSGGCFQNAYLAQVLPALLRRRGFRVLCHHKVPPNDGGISLGQAVVVRERLRKR